MTIVFGGFQRAIRGSIREDLFWGGMKAFAAQALIGAISARSIWQGIAQSSAPKFFVGYALLEACVVLHNLTDQNITSPRTMRASYGDFYDFVNFVRGFALSTIRRWTGPSDGMRGASDEIIGEGDEPERSRGAGRATEWLPTMVRQLAIQQLTRNAPVTGMILNWLATAGVISSEQLRTYRDERVHRPGAGGARVVHGRPGGARGLVGAEFDQRGAGAWAGGAPAAGGATRSQFPSGDESWGSGSDHF